MLSKADIFRNLGSPALSQTFVASLHIAGLTIKGFVRDRKSVSVSNLFMETYADFRQSRDFSSLFKPYINLFCSLKTRERQLYTLKAFVYYTIKYSSSKSCSRTVKTVTESRNL